MQRYKSPEYVSPEKKFGIDSCKWQLDKLIPHVYVCLCVCVCVRLILPVLLP